MSTTETTKHTPEAWKALIEACRKAEQLANVARDWNLDEVEIDGEMVDTIDLVTEFRAAIAKAGVSC